MKLRFHLTLAGRNVKNAFNFLKEILRKLAAWTELFSFGVVCKQVFKLCLDVLLVHGGLRNFSVDFQDPVDSLIFQAVE